MKAFTIRPARPDEAGVILDLIKQLAVYERCENDVVADEATLRRIASMTGTDEQMFLMMYRFVFSRELRQGAPATPAMSAAEEEKQKEDLPPELVSLSHSIMALPAEKKDGLVRAIQEMMQVFCPA